MNIEIKNQINWNENKFIIARIIFDSVPTMGWMTTQTTHENNMISIEI